MNKIKIRKNPNGDTRTAPKDVSFEQFQQANDMHKEDVKNTMNYLSTLVWDRGISHDDTKKTREGEFYDDFLSTMNDGNDFTKSEWYQYHINSERHHLLSRCPEDVNLIDVLEMIADCVCAGLARSGEVRDLEIDTDILEKAVGDTVKLLQSNMVLETRAIPYTYILIYHSKPSDLHRTYLRLYDELKLRLSDSVEIKSTHAGLARIDIGDYISIDFRCSDVSKCAGLRPNYYFADTWRAEEFIAQGAYKCNGKCLNKLDDILDIVSNLLLEEEERRRLNRHE